MVHLVPDEALMPAGPATGDSPDHVGRFVAGSRKTYASDEHRLLVEAIGDVLNLPARHQHSMNWR